MKPIKTPSHRDLEKQSRKLLFILGLLGLLLLGTFGVIGWLSPQFRLSVPGIKRPILLTLGLFTLAFLFYLFAIAVASKVQLAANKQLWLIIVGFAIAFRLTLLFSLPIQEVDLHRYIWDGVVFAEGISPFKFPPDKVLNATPKSTADSELRRLAQIREQDPGLKYILDELHKHFGYLPTVYPPTSQAVFAMAAKSTPMGTTYENRVRIMKSWLTVFDLGIVILVLSLLRLCHLPIGLGVAYAWCPLVLKEVANSGHLDTIAVFFTTLAIYCLAVAMVRWGQAQETSNRHPISEGWLRTSAALSLALAVGAKLYPIVLAPLLLFVAIRRFGWKQAIVPTFVFVSCTLALIWPMLPNSGERTRQASIATADSEISIAANQPSDGIQTFLAYWEMNDFLFMLLVENLKPGQASEATGENSEKPPVWFSIVPNNVRTALVNPIATMLATEDQTTGNLTPLPGDLTAFVITRFLTSLGFFALALWLAWKASSQENPIALCQVAFLTLAWFWLLSPTQNPWYWLWPLPFLPFMKNRAWFALSGLVMAYYLRFWFSYHFSDQDVAGTYYQGASFFDFIVTWIEFGPWLLWLMMESLVRRKATSD